MLILPICLLYRCISIVNNNAFICLSGDKMVARATIAMK